MTDSEKIELLEAKMRILELEIEAMKSKAPPPYYPWPVVPWTLPATTERPWTITF